jgi:hypothetical protein
MTEIQDISREIDQLIHERDDFIEITSLTDSKAWLALVRKLDAAEKMMMDSLLVELEPQMVRWHQGFIAGVKSVKETVAKAAEETKTMTEEISIKTQQKDELFDHQE